MNNLALIDHRIFWSLIAIAYFQGIYELVNNKYKKRDILFVGLFTVAILIYIILYNC